MQVTDGHDSETAATLEDLSERWPDRLQVTFDDSSTRTHELFGAADALVVGGDSVDATLATLRAHRYGVLPGDDPAASTRFAGTWGATDDGDGDGEIEGGWDATTNNSESRMMWKHLRGAGLVAGPVDNTDLSYQQPTSSFGGIIGVDVDLYGLNGANIVFGQLPGDIAGIVDGRADDSNPSVGSVRGHATDTSYALDTAYDVAFEL